MIPQILIPIVYGIGENRASIGDVKGGEKR